MINMIKKKKQMFIIIGVFALVLFLGSTSYAWFNYSRTTSDNELIAGDIYLHLNEGQGEIELSNIFPETVEEARSRNDNFITFTVDGLNTSNKTIYYEFILDHGEDKANPKTRYNDTDLRFDLIALDSNGDEIDYLISGGSFDTLINKRIWVDTVDANTTTEIVRRYKLRMWLDENVIISDTDPKATYDTTEYKNKYATIKLTVAGDFNEKHIDYLYNIMKKSAVMDNVSSEFVSASTGIDFGAVSSDTNGKGVYMRVGTENDANPILYYRGAVENNNVLFANQCWKAVRTTDTGGVKLIYNGTPSEVFEKVALEESNYTIVTNTDNKFTFNSADNTWTANSVNEQIEISFKVPAGDNYEFHLLGQLGQPSGTSAGGSFTIFKGGIPANGGGGNYGSELGNVHNFGTLTADDVIKFTFSGSGFSSEYPNTFKIKMTQRGDSLGSGCENSDTATQITLSGTNTFPFSGTNLDKSLAYNGYMWGEVYEWTNAATTSGAYYGTGFTWDGTNYTLTNAKVGYDGTHHYTCNQTSAEGTCSNIRYYYYVSGTGYEYYITLTGGDSIEKAIEKMQTNTNPSNAKQQIESWFATNMTSYINQLEDTIWCNDRSITTKGGWDPTGNVTADNLYYSGYNRFYNTHTPSLACSNKNDSFTWKNASGNQKLNYPVAMLTVDEMMLAGGTGTGSTGTFYLNSGSNIYWSLSPSIFDYNHVYEFYVNRGSVSRYDVNYSSGLRPSVSLKHGTPVVSGTGTVNDPYVIE